MTNPTPQEQERDAIVAWLRREGEIWDLKTQEYRRNGNNGPYLGEPSGWGFAARIEAGDHLSKHE